VIAGSVLGALIAAYAGALARLKILERRLRVSKLMSQFEGPGLILRFRFFASGVSAMIAVVLLWTAAGRSSGTRRIRKSGLS